MLADLESGPEHLLCRLVQTLDNLGQLVLARQKRLLSTVNVLLTRERWWITGGLNTQRRADNTAHLRARLRLRGFIVSRLAKDGCRQRRNKTNSEKILHYGHSP